MNKKIIFMTINHGIIARNLLLNSFFDKLKSEYKVIIFSSLDKKDFLDSFKIEGVTFCKLKKQKLSKIENKFYSVQKALIYNPTIKIKSKYGTSLKHKQKRTWKKKFRNYFEQIVFGLFLSKFKFLRDLLKLIDAKIYNDDDFYQAIFDKYKPVAIFTTNISLDNEVYLLRTAKKNKVLSFGMTKSWDNFSKIGFREKVDKLIVWSDYMKDEAIEFQNYKEDDVLVAGIPQFDIYHNIKNKYTKKDFCDIYKLDKEKKIILFGSAGPILSPDDPYIVSIIKKWIIKDNKDYQILIRPHRGHKNATDSFFDLVDNKVVFMDLLHKSSKFTDGWDLSYEHLLRLALSMRFSDVLVTSITTLALDALASSNKIICYYFDEDKNKPFSDSIRRLYETLWHLELRKYGLEKFMVNNKEELLDRIEEELKKPNNDYPKEVKEIISRFCYKVDGKSGERLFNFIDSTIEELYK